MTQYVINIGTIPNDGTGDPLRTAFNEVNLNFNQIWATGLVGSNITVANNTILTSNTNGNLILNPNGIGIVQANAHIIPDQTRVRNLGSSNVRWNYVYGQYLDVVNANITTANISNIGILTIGVANLHITGGSNGYVLQTDGTGNLTWTAQTGGGGNGVPGGANTQVQFNNAGEFGGAPGFTFTSSTNALAVGGNVTSGNLITGGIVSASGNVRGANFNTAGTVSAAGNIYGANILTTGNIVPTTSNAYSLGNSTNQWLDLYVSNATIYMNNVPISLTAGNILTVNGNDVVTTNANGQTSLGNLSVDNNNIYNTNGQGVVISNFSFIAEAETAYVQIPAGNSASDLNVVQEQGNVRIAANAAAWLFDTNGTLTVPGDITSSGTFAINSGDDISISGGNQPANSAVSEGGDVTIFGGTGRLDNGISTGSGGDIRLNAGDGGDGVSSGAGPGGYAEVQGGTGGGANVDNNIQAGEGGYVVIQGGQGGDNAGNLSLSGLGGNVEIYGGTGSADGGNSTISGAAGHVNLYGGNWGFVGVATGNIYLNTYDGSNFKTLTFDNTGNLTIPNGGYINFVNTGGITQALNEDLRFTVSDDEEDGWAIQSTVNDGAGNDLTRMQVMYDGVAINTDIPTNNYRWDFRDTGEFDVPKSIRGPVGGNLVIECGDQPGSDTYIDLQTRSYVGDALISNIRIANPNVTVSTSSGAYNWTFDNTANLNLPPSGNIVGVTANNSGHINWFGNSSGDNNGYTTLRLVPDDTRESSDQYLIIDPTAPGHIHIRAGGTQDNSNADLFLGGENSYFKVNAGANNEVRISANSHAWTFGADSILTVPGEGVIRSIQDTVILQSYDIYGNTYSARLGTNGGLYFETTDYPGGWLSLTNNAGNANITAASGTAGGAGKNIYITAGSADQGDYYTTQGGDVNITGGLGATNDGGGGGHGGNVNITAGLSADPAGVAGNVTITSGSWNWQFINNGNLYVPGQINGDNNGALVIDGAGYGNGYISLPASSFGGEQIAIVNDFSLGNGIRLQTNGGNLFFDNDGDLSVTGNISTTGNIVAGNLSVTGNVVGDISFIGGNILIDNATGAGGSDEGGELHFAAATANSTLSGPIAIDIYQSKMRFFETQGNTFGMYIDIANSMGVAGSSLGVPAIGYRDVPQISLSANVTANVTNAGKHFYSTTAGNITLTIPDNANVSFPTGATLTVVMNAAGNVIVAQGTGVSLYMAGSSTTGNRVVGAYGLASVMKVATDTWVISGTGVY